MVEHPIEPWRDAIEIVLLGATRGDAVQCLAIDAEPVADVGDLAVEVGKAVGGLWGGRGQTGGRHRAGS